MIKIGRFIRRWNIKELPEFRNQFRRDISGPRPERPELIPEFKEQIPHDQARHAVKPGMSGWAQLKSLARLHAVDRADELGFGLFRKLELVA